MVIDSDSDSVRREHFFNGLGTLSLPAWDPKPDDQGDEKICIGHALAKAICAMRDLNGDNQIGVWPDRFINQSQYPGAAVMMRPPLPGFPAH